MKRNIALLTVLLLTVLAVIGCGSNSLADYKKAADKTDQIVKGQNSAEFSMTLDFNTEGLPPEALNELNYYKNVSGSFRSVFDTGRGQGIYRNYMNTGGLGFDFDLYQNGEEMFVKLPIVGKYMKLDDMLKEAEQGPDKTSRLISEDTMKALKAEWVGMLKQEDVFKGKDIVLTTPDGEVKTKVYTITLNDEQAKSLEENSLTILSKDENLKTNYEALMEKKAGRSKPPSFEELIAKAKDQVKKETVDSFQYTAYVDIDGYIVNETVDMKIKRDGTEQGEPKSIDFRLEMKSWDINEDQKLEFPVLTDDNTIKSKDLDQTMPLLFKYLFQAE